MTMTMTMKIVYFQTYVCPYNIKRYTLCAISIISYMLALTGENHRYVLLCKIGYVN